MGDSASFDFSKLGTRMDFIFIDGSHAYEYVLRDSETARGLLRDGRGLIAVASTPSGWASIKP